MSLRSLAIVAITVLILMAAVLASFGVLATAGRGLLTLPCVLLLPGYTIMRALFPRKQLGSVEMLVFSLGMSLVAVVLGGLLLNLTPWGLTTVTWAVFLATVIAGAGTVAVMQQGGVRGAMTISLRAVTGRRRYSGLLAAAAALLLIGAIQVAAAGVKEQPEPGFTQLWILPVPPNSSTSHSVQLGVRNTEGTTTTYRLQLTVQGRTDRTWSHLTVLNDATWRVTILLPSGLPRSGKVQATLYRASQPSIIYRRVWVEPDHS